MLFATAGIPQNPKSTVKINWKYCFFTAGRIDVMSIVERSRNTRSHSLKPLTQPSLLTQRSKRTLSLPNKAIIPPVINIQRCYDQDENFSGDEDRHNLSAISDDMSCMGK